MKLSLSTKTSPRLSSKYQIVIPREVRKRLDLSKGSRVRIESLDETHAILIKESTDHVVSMKGLGKEIWKQLGGATKYLKGERGVWDRS